MGQKIKELAEQQPGFYDDSKCPDPEYDKPTDPYLELIKTEKVKNDGTTSNEHRQRKL